MNLLDSHDTERLRWTLTPGVETTVGREETASNVAAGKLRVKLASLIQFTVPGAPTDLLRRRGRDDRRRRPGRPADVPVGRYGWFARHGHAGPLHGARGVARQGQGTDRRRLPHPVRERRRRRPSPTAGEAPTRPRSSSSTAPTSNERSRSRWLATSRTGSRWRAGSAWANAATGYAWRRRRRGPRHARHRCPGSSSPPASRSTSSHRRRRRASV